MHSSKGATAGTKPGQHSSNGATAGTKPGQKSGEDAAGAKPDQKSGKDAVKPSQVSGGTNAAAVAPRAVASRILQEL